MLGQNHEVALAYRSFQELIQWLQIELNGKIGPGMDLQPVHVLRKVQLSLYYYFDTKHHCQTPSAPNFMDILHCIVQDEFLKPKLPAALMSLGPGPMLRGPTLSDAPRTTPEKPKGPTKVVNLHPVASLLKFVKPGARLYDLKGNKEVPKNRDGTEMCLAFHLNGECYSHCTQKYDHRMHGAPENKALHEFIKVLEAT